MNISILYPSNKFSYGEKQDNLFSKFRTVVYPSILASNKAPIVLKLFRDKFETIPLASTVFVRRARSPTLVLLHFRMHFPVIFGLTSTCYEICMANIYQNYNMRVNVCRYFTYKGTYML